MHTETQLVQIGKNRGRITGAVSCPVYHSTAYEHPALGESTGFDYTRTANPTRQVVEQAIAELEGGEAGFACSSGMAAIQTIMGLFSKGDHLIVSLDLYGGTYRLFEEVLTRYGITFSYVDLRDLEAIEEAATPYTCGIFVESPTNPLMRVTDIRAVCERARDRGWLSIIDNTFMTPYLQRPLELGADIVIHSATKYLGGHNDVLAGLIVTKGKDLSEKVFALHNSIGAVLGPQDCWLLMRGIKTLALRMEKHQENAMALTQFLLTHPAVEEVFYPTLHSEERRIQEEQAGGYGGMLSFRVKDPVFVPEILRSLRLISFAESLGGVESLVTYPATQTHAEIPEEIRRKVGVCDKLLRLSVGIEHMDDLIGDLSQAFDRAQASIEGEGVKRDELRNSSLTQRK
ncbi:aminotransferase class I/II-fold pyridoxal phosphate-dependent enzyme [Paludifilum halophilum]|uniref:Cystathionine gamma-synthase n=1 Tax=Paludifilum halophilum TaxID=1642702 RepID=A0A235B7Q7_9BACL|nr:aminotransferase class I/II-fold pyridoxal phosphate-dependent enzyme [Paludifilum halophilum]OYD07625.1 cystathionine gamma-synthase [Paludifilum halophilum]